MNKLWLVVTLVLSACAAGSSTGLQYARGSLNGAYDAVVVARKGCKETPPASTCKLSDERKARILAVAGSLDDVLKLLEITPANPTPNPQVADCLAIVNRGMTAAAKPPIVAASSCLSLAITVTSILEELLPEVQK